MRIILFIFFLYLFSHSEEIIQNVELDNSQLSDDQYPQKLSIKMSCVIPGAILGGLIGMWVGGSAKADENCDSEFCYGGYVGMIEGGFLGGLLGGVSGGLLCLKK